MFTLRDSVRPQFRNPRPLGYLLTYFLVRPFRPLDEFGLRLLPAVFGVLAIPAFYWVTRRLVGTRAALFAALLLTVSGWHVFYSQFARYWSLVFLFAAIYPFALYVGVRDRNGRALALGFVPLVLGVLAHPGRGTPGGRPHHLADRDVRSVPGISGRPGAYPAFRWGAAIALVLLVALSFRLVPILPGLDLAARSESRHGTVPAAVAKLAQGLKQILLLAAYFEGLTFPVVLAAAGGHLSALARSGTARWRVFLASLAVFPLALHRADLDSHAGVDVLPAAHGARCSFSAPASSSIGSSRWTGRSRPRWLVPVTITVMIVLAGGCADLWSRSIATGGASTSGAWRSGSSPQLSPARRRLLRPADGAGPLPRQPRGARSCGTIPTR